MLTFSHSGTTGDVFNSLSVVKLLGGGHLYLKLHNMDRMIQEKLGWPSAGFHSGRMSLEDFKSMESFILEQDYITGFTVWAGEKVDYDLDEMARHHEVGVFPRNFPNQYAKACGLDLEANKIALQMRPYMTCNTPLKIKDRPIVIFRGKRYQDGNNVISPQWQEWVDYGLSDQSVFIGFKEEHEWFNETFKTSVPYFPTATFKDMASVIAGSEMLITSMSSPCAVGLALGKTMWIETRKNETMERLEVNYPYRTNIFYF